MLAQFLDPRLPMRFWDKLVPEPNSGCWLWLACRNGDGYGMFKLGQRMRLAHGVAYQMIIGEVPDGLELDHRVCRNTACCNPAHLEPVTHAINMARSARSLRSACINGHPFSEQNTYLWKNARICRVCNRAKALAQNARRRVAGRAT